MGVLDKKLFLADLQTRLDAFVPANDAKKIIEQAADALTGYEMTTVARDGIADDDSESMIKLFLDAKTVEGRSIKIINASDKYFLLIFIIIPPILPNYQIRKQNHHNLLRGRQHSKLRLHNRDSPNH